MFGFLVSYASGKVDLVAGPVHADLVVTSECLRAERVPVGTSSRDWYRPEPCLQREAKMSVTQHSATQSPQRSDGHRPMRILYHYTCTITGSLRTMACAFT
jgi:hypothetical protein